MKPIDNAGRLTAMQDPKRFDACFQGARIPREGEKQEHVPDETGLGDLCLAVGNVKDALAYYKSALAKVDGDDITTRVAIVVKTSACLRRQGKADEALAFVETILDSFKHRHRRGLLAEKATLLCLLGRYGDAARVCKEAHELEVGSDRAEEARVYLVLGHVLSRLCRWRQAAICLEQAATFGRMCGDLTTLGNALNNLGIVNKNLCRLADSTRCLAEAVQVARRTRDDASLAVRLLNLANTLYKQGEIDQADKAITECMKITAVLNIGRTHRLAVICKARIEKVKGNLNGARRLLEGTISDLENLDDPRACLVAKETLSEILLEEGDLKGARDLLEFCLEHLDPQVRDVEAELRTRLAEAYLGLGRRAVALNHARQAATVAEEIGDLFEAGRAYRVLALATSPGQESSKYISRAEDLFSKMMANLELGMTAHARSRIMGGLGPEAAASLKEAILTLRRCGARKAHLRALCDLAVAYGTMGRHEQAVSCLDEAKALSVGRRDEEGVIARARADVDGSISDSLSLEQVRGPVSLDAAFSWLTQRLEPACMILAEVGNDSKVAPNARRAVGQVPVRIIKTYEIHSHQAAELVRLLTMRSVMPAGAGPLVFTDLASLDHDASGPHLHTLFGYRLSKSGAGGLFVACWGGASDGSRCGSPGISRFIKACYELERVAGTLEKAIRPEVDALKPMSLGGMLTADNRLKSVLLSLRRIADGSANVLIAGETGTGKELVARAIHALSRRKEHPFVAQNCAALPEQLLESELFGHKAGAFTGARCDKKGLLEAADGGTFLLDEVGDVGLAIQAKLLRAIETGEIRRLGDTVTRRIDVRILSATNKDLEAEVEAGRFRPDLFYRLNVVSVHLPPLRERDYDVEILSRLFLERFAAKMAKAIGGIGDGAMRALVNYDWPGNVRQLENEIEKAVTLVESGGRITEQMLSPAITGSVEGTGRPSLRDELRMVERRRILAALKRCGWNKTHAARLLGGISRPALVAKMKRLGIPLRPA
jgi:DNA-binding NtrC family response regulator/tetratricopeptide (TPR) repeat protein